MGKYRFKIEFTKPQSAERWTGIGYFHEQGGESFLSITFMSYEIAVGRMEANHE